jgi:hypothetical protein
MSLDSSVGIETGYGLDDRMVGVRFPTGAGNFSLRHRVQTGSGAHTVSYPTDTEGSFSGSKAAWAWSWPYTPSSAEVKNAWSYTSTPQYVFMAWCLVKHRDNFTFTLPYCLHVRGYFFLTYDDKNDKVRSIVRRFTLDSERLRKTMKNISYDSRSWRVTPEFPWCRQSPNSVFHLKANHALHSALRLVHITCNFST